MRTGTGSQLWRSHIVNESVAFFEEHLRSEILPLESLYFEGRQQELRDGVGDTSGAINDFKEYFLHTIQMLSRPAAQGGVLSQMPACSIAGSFRSVLALLEFQVMRLESRARLFATNIKVERAIVTLDLTLVEEAPVVGTALAAVVFALLYPEEVDRTRDLRSTMSEEGGAFGISLLDEFSIYARMDVLRRRLPSSR